MKKQLLFLLTLITVSANAQIAITEFMNHPKGADATHEWVELYNYGTSAVNLRNWSLQDEDSDSTVISTTDLIVQPGFYIVLTANKDTFETNWLSGIPSSVVFEYTGSFLLSNSSDEIILKNDAGAEVWSVAYLSDEIEGLGTYLTYAHDFTSSLTTWGSKSAPGIVREGIDPISSTLGYEIDSSTADVRATMSAMGDKASPLSGDYPSGVTSLDEFKNDLLSIYPNPALNVINFSEAVSGQIVDITGKMVVSFANQKQVDVTNLKSGIFFVAIENKTYRLVKQ